MENAHIVCKKLSVQSRFVVMPGNFDNLLSYEISVELGVVNRINAVQDIVFKALMMAKFPRLFENRTGLRPRNMMRTWSESWTV